MKKTSIGLVVGILAITALILMSGTALANSTTNGTNATNNTNATATPTTIGTVVATGNVTTTVTDDATEIIEETETPAPKKTEQKVTPVKTVNSKPTESPGFESVMAIVVILSAIYIFRTNRK